MRPADLYRCPVCNGLLQIPAGSKVTTTLERREGGPKMRIITMRGRGELHRCELRGASEVDRHERL